MEAVGEELVPLPLPTKRCPCSGYDLTLTAIVRGLFEVRTGNPFLVKCLIKMACLIKWVLPALIFTKFHPYGANFMCEVLPYGNNKWEQFFPTVKFPYNFMGKIHSSRC
jgi:hypothetical protein